MRVMVARGEGNGQWRRTRFLPQQLFQGGRWNKVSRTGGSEMTREKKSEWKQKDENSRIGRSVTGGVLPNCLLFIFVAVSSGSWDGL